MPRCERKLSKSGVYHIMLRGNERKDIFKSDEQKRYFNDCMILKQQEMRFSVYAYCIMNNHVHIALQSEGNDIAIIMKGIAIRYAFFYNTKHQRVGHVFQDRYKSETVEDDRYLLAVIRYIHNNPVKAGMVAKPGDYPWSSYSDYLKQSTTDQGLVDTKLVLGILSDGSLSAIREFERFSNESDESRFLDLDDIEEVRTLAEGRVFLADYLKKEWDGLSWNELKKNAESRQGVIRDIRTHTRLSVRSIAELLGISKNSVH